MPDADIEDKVELYEHFFRDPQVGEGILQPAHAGIACRNIRDALRLLDYPVARGDVYDDELRKAVLRFQIDYKHVKQDGFVGPGTRKLLTRVVIGNGKEWFFKRGRISPEYAIFLSYSRKDEDLVAGMVNAIRSQGIAAFRDKEAILGGASWPDVLYRSIRKCQVFLCVLSPCSAASISVFIELALARHSERPIVPVLLQAVELPAAMQALIGGIQYIDLEGKVGSKKGTDELLQALSAHGVFPQPQQLHSQE